jgi:hypothetical protein
LKAFTLSQIVGVQLQGGVKKGRENKVVDALSRATHSQQILAISAAVPIWIEQVLASYEHDTTYLNLIS